eukprot:403364826
MIFALTGNLNSGKSTLAQYLKEDFGFNIVNLFEEFAGQHCNDADKLVQHKHYFSIDNKPKVIAILSLWLDRMKGDWKQHYVLYPLPLDQDYEHLIDKYNVLIFSVQAPTLDRFTRFSKQQPEVPLQEFLALDDICTYGSMNDNSLKITKTFVNSGESIDKFYSQLKLFNFKNNELVRPLWDTYFLRMCEIIASRSNCMKRSVGCVIVNDHRIVSTGYNGTPFGMENCSEGGCERCNTMTPSGVGLEECLCIHAEQNAVIEAGRAKCIGGTIYVNLSPCLTCSKSIIQAGIKRIVFNRKYIQEIAEKFWKKYEGQVEVVQHSILI